LLIDRTTTRGLEHVPDAADGVDQRLAVRVDLLAQIADVQLDDVGLAAEVIVPDPVQDLGLGQHPARIAHQESQQLKLGRRQVDHLVAPAHLAGVFVHGQVANHQLDLAAGPGQARPAEQPAQPGQHFLQAERLGDVVVAARGDPGHPVIYRVLSREEQHAHVRGFLPYPAEHFQAVEVRQHDVQDHGIGPELAGGPDRRRAVPGRHDLPAFITQHTGQQLSQAWLVVDDQHPDRAAVQPPDRGRPARSAGLSGGARLGHGAGRSGLYVVHHPSSMRSVARG
jgi:hypothetical protein